MDDLEQRLRRKGRGVLPVNPDGPEAADRLRAYREALTDPNAVHANMLRGDIAKPSPAQVWHIYGKKLLDAMPPALQVKP